ncbi:MAG: DNA repair protein RecN [Chloroflexi bacterium]|nr:DNA repair protein RecN [Chloroflexota bacterium]
MLVQLTVRDLAIVDRLELTWASGLNVLTGETGAGKSIIVDALGALLGDRLGPEHVRHGAARAVVEGVFALDLARDSLAELRALLDERGLLEDEEALILAREVAGLGGRSLARINGHAVPLSLLAEVGTHLVDIHGQSQHLSLMRPREHLGLLDRFAGLVERRALLAALVAELRRAQRELQEVVSEERQARREAELLRHEVAEIEAAGPRVDEEQELLRQRSRLRNVERLRAAATAAHQAVQGNEEQRGAAELLRQAAVAAREIARLDPAAGGEFGGLEEAAALVEEVGRALASYLDQIEADPGLLERTEERLLALADLKRRYGDTLAEVLRYLGTAQARLERLEHRDQHLADLEARARALRAQVGAAAGTLSQARQQAGAALARAVEQELAELSMAGARFRVDFRWEVDAEGVPVAQGEEPAQALACDASGIDRVEFLISANPGEAPRALARIASGGELARVSLALKAILSRADHRPTLVFDEVDVGVGGRSGAVVGQKLWALSREHQVLCVTHLPQVAAFADLHVVVSKQVMEGQTSVVAQPAEQETRLAELAAMLSGSAASTTARESAQELLRRSHEAKAGR